MQIDIVTLFPSMFKGPFDESIVKRAIDKRILMLKIHNLRNWAIDKRGTVDDRPFGGGTGMLLRPEPIFSAVEAIQSKTTSQSEQETILLDAGGTLYNQQTTNKLSKLKQLILICGHYEGVDYRVHEHLADKVISIGDYVLTGGEIPAMLIVDSVTRLLPGVLKNQEATQNESFSMTAKSDASEEFRSVALKTQLLEYPQYTRPKNYKGYKVPPILLCGNHAEIEKWRGQKSLERTRKSRPDLISSRKI